MNFKQNKKSLLFFALVALAAVIALSACGNANDNNNGNNAGNTATGIAPAGTQAAGGGGSQEITVNATNWAFDQQDIQAKVGDTLKITLQNKEGNHGLEIPDLAVNIKNGETATITLDKAGTFEYHCSIQCGSGHTDMTGKITVS